MAKVLVVGDNLDLPEFKLFIGLISAGYELDFALSPGSPYTAALVQAGAEVFSLRTRSRFDWRSIFNLRSLLLSKQYDILHCLTSKSLAAGALASWGMELKRVAYRGTSGRLNRWNPLAYLTFLNPKLDRIICVSESVRTFMSTLVAPAKLITIYKGHELDWYPSSSKLTRDELGISDSQSFLVGCVANLRPVKGLIYLIRAMALLPHHPRIELLVIGEIRRRKWLKRRPAAELRELQKLKRLAPETASRIHFLGHRSDVPALLVHCQAFVLPSVDREGLPKAMLEALAMGLPTIVTEVGGMAEVIKNQENGLTVPPRDALSLATAMLRVAEDASLAAKLSKNGRLSIDEHFHCRRSVKETSQLYQELLSFSGA